MALDGVAGGIRRGPGSMLAPEVGHLELWLLARLALESCVGRSWAEQLHRLDLDRVPVSEEVGCVRNQAQDESQKSERISADG